MVIPLLFVGLTALVASLIPGATLDLGMENYLSTLDATTAAVMDDLFQTLPFHPIWLLAGQSLIGGITINAIFAFGEEIGWRGFLLREFQLLGFWKASLLIGIIWGVWHEPLILFARHNYSCTPIIWYVHIDSISLVLSHL